MRVDFVGFADKHRLCKQTQAPQIQTFWGAIYSLSLSLSFSPLFSGRIFKIFNSFCSFFFIYKAKIHNFHSKIHKFTPFSRKIQNNGKFFQKIQKIHNFHKFSSNFHSTRFQNPKNFEKFNTKDFLWRHEKNTISSVS